MRAQRVEAMGKLTMDEPAKIRAVIRAVKSFLVGASVVGLAALSAYLEVHYGN